MEHDFFNIIIFVFHKLICILGIPLSKSDDHASFVIQELISTMGNCNDMSLVDKGTSAFEYVVGAVASQNGCLPRPFPEFSLSVAVGSQYSPIDTTGVSGATSVLIRTDC
uniref:U9-Theriditoxin-Lha1a_1 n=1 Tax=Latrodectus hasselti TaxID=256736 RepID=A0A482ZBA1_LATHA